MEFGDKKNTEYHNIAFLFSDPGVLINRSQLTPSFSVTALNHGLMWDVLSEASL